jgi:hypothetical protein
MENQKLIEVVSCFNLLVSIIEDALMTESEDETYVSDVVKENIETVVGDIETALDKSDSNIFASWRSSVSFINNIINENIDNFNDEVGLTDEDNLSMDQLRRIKRIAKSQTKNIKFVIKH